jgi:iron complex outermembrane receptor protein
MEVRRKSDTALATVIVRNIVLVLKKPFCEGQKRRFMKSKIFLSFILTLIFAIGVSAQTGATVSGIVSDLKNPLPNTKVVLTSASNQAQITQTDGQGRYVFENVAKGKYNISVLRADNTIFISKDIIVGKDQPLTIDLTYGIQRPSNVIKVGEVVIIASGFGQPFDEVSKTVNVVENQEIQARNEFSLTDALRTIPGFRVQQLGGFGRTANIKTRGLRNQDTAVLIDGIRFRDASSITGDASAFLSDFTFTGTNRVEVLRGSGSSLYGTNAIGGVLDVQTAKPAKDFHGAFLGEYGGLGLKRFRGNISDGNDQINFNLGVSRTVFTEGIDGEDDARNTNAQGRVDYNPFQKTGISARFYISDAYVRLNSNPDTIGNLPTVSHIIQAVPLSPDLLKNFENGATPSNFGSANFIPDANDPDAYQKSKFYNGQLLLTKIINDRLVFQSSYQALKTSRKNINGVSGSSEAASVFEGQIHTLNGHFNYVPTANHQLTFGYEYEWEKFGNAGFSANVSNNFTTRARQNSNTFYVQDLLSFFGRRLQIAGGFRAQFFYLGKPNFSSPNAPYQNAALENPPTAYTGDGSISYFFEKSKTKIRAHVGNGYRVPSLYERFGTFYSTFGTPGFVGLGDPRLKPERSISFDGGVDQTIFGSRAKLSATYFYTRLQRTIDFSNSLSRDPFERFFGYINSEGAISRGAEFSTEVKPFSSTNLFASYTFTNSDQRAPQIPGSGILKTLGVPVHQFTLVATQRIANRLTLNFDFLATSSYLNSIFSNTIFSSRIYQFQGARKADVTASYELPSNGDKLRFRLFGTVENLFDYDYYENGFRTAGRTARGGLSVAF